jgi:hypothetical protein
LFNGEIRVAQPEIKPDLKARIEALEKKFNNHLESEKRIIKKSGPAEIRTQDLRRVKATS